MPAPRRFTVCLLLVLPLLCSVAFSRLSPAQGQAGKPPVSMLTKEQEAELDALNTQAKEAYSKGHLNMAEKLFLQGLEKAETLKDAAYTARFLNGLGIVYYSLGQNEKALDYFTRALALYEKIGNPATVAVTLNNLGNVYHFLGQNEQALDYYNRALTIREKIGSPADIAATLNNLGNIYGSLGQNEKALDQFTRVLAINEKIGSPADIDGTLNSLGNVYSDLSRFEKALDYYTRALVLREKMGNPADIAASLSKLGVVYYSRGQNEKALDYYVRAFALYEKIGSPANIAATLNNLGNVYGSLGQNEKALDYYNRAHNLFDKIGNPADIAVTLNNLGNVYHFLGQNEQALDYYNRARALHEKVGNPATVASTLNNLGNVYLDLGQNEKALDYYNRALAINEKIGSPADIAGTLNSLGNVYSDLSRFEKALDYYTRALVLREKMGNPANIAASLNNLGIVYSDLGRLEEAEKEFAESKRLRESVSLQVGDPSEVGALQERYHHFYERYARLRLKRHHPEEALEMLEAGRGQGLARQIDLSQRGDITRFFTAEEVMGLQEKAQRLRDALIFQRKAEKQAETAIPARRETLQKQAETGKTEAQTAEREYGQFRDTLFARYPQLRATAENQPAPFSRLKTLAAKHPDTLYLEWGVVNDKTTLLFAYGSRDKLKPLTLSTGEKALGEVAQKWRDTLDASGGRRSKADDTAHRTNATGEEKALAKQAYRLLLVEAEKAGLLAEGRYTRLVIVGSGPILDMPLAALCDSQGRRLIERYAVSHAFSLSSFFYQNKTPQKAVSLFCIADPTDRSEQGVGEAEGQGRGRSAFRAGFAALPGAREEGKAVAELFAGSKLLVGPEAREAEVTRLLPEYGLLHFATHGYVVPRALDSGLVLAEETAESQYTGLLTAKKILNVPLSARLAVLSACETGRGRLSGGDGLMGMAWAFRAAGCPALVVSQWAVNDAATKEWMLAFYRALKAGKSKDVALQAAMLVVKKAHPSPFYWAAFELIGETEALNLTPQPK